MLISKHLDLEVFLRKFDIFIGGIIHIGAHDCQEKEYYNEKIKVSDDDIIWIDAMQHMVDLNKKKGIKNIFCQAISNEDNQELTFHESNDDGQASSLLEFGIHAKHHPEIKVKKEYKVITKKLDTFLYENSFNPSKYNFWNLDIQGAELMALRGATESIKYADAIYLEVNEVEVYKGCGTIDQIDDFLYSVGFKRVWTDMLTWNWGDALYIKNKTNIPITPIMLRHDKHVFVDRLLYDNGTPPYLEIANNKKININAQDKNGKTALQYACESQNLEVVKLLLEHGADQKIHSGDKTLLEIAKDANNNELMTILLSK